MRARCVAFLVALVGLLLGVIPAEPAAAAGATNVAFVVNGDLGLFPCPQGCYTSFYGTGSGGGRTSAVIDGVGYDASFTFVQGSVTGGAHYTEPPLPLCPVLGFASDNLYTGTVSLTGGTGVIYRTSSPTLAGTVTNVAFTFSYTYVRAGAIPAIAITGGSLTVSYVIPGSGGGSFTRPIAAGAATGVFAANPVQAALLCTTPGGPLHFTIAGDATFVTA